MNTLILPRLIVFMVVFVCTISFEIVGRVQNAMLITNTTRTAILVKNSTAINCLCQALKTVPTVIAINYFSDNFTCEIFTSYGSSYQLYTRSLSTVVLIQSLPSRPSITSNLTWLLNKMSNGSEYKNRSLSYTNNLYIDNYNRLVTNVWFTDLVQMDRYTLAITNRTTLDPKFAALTYHNGVYYVGCGDKVSLITEKILTLYNSTTLKFMMKLIDFTSGYGPIRQAVFARNGTLMILLVQDEDTYSRVLFYRVNSPINYTLLDIDIITPSSGAYNIIKANDTLFYLILYYNYKPIYKLKSSLDGLDWQLEIFNKSGTPSPKLVSSIALDPDGRLWAVDEYDRIYIYDTITGQLLGTFNKILEPYHIIILDKYEFYIGTKTGVVRIPPRV